jgi:NDP-sugar pyrophosphorylase family protein
MDYSLFDAIRSGFSKVVFIVRGEILETVREIFLPRIKDKVEVDFVIQSLDTLVPAEFRNSERTKPWGTAHAMLCAKNAISEPFAVINADDFYGHEAFRAVADFFNADTGGDHALVGYTLKNVLSDFGSVSRGVGEEDNRGYLTSVVERVNVSKQNGKIVAREKDGDVELNPEAKTSMNFWGFHPSIFPFTEKTFHEFLKENSKNIKAEFFIPIVANKLVKTGAGKIKVISGGSTWFGVTYKEDKEEVSQKIRSLVAKGEYPAKLWT